MKKILRILIWVVSSIMVLVFCIFLLLNIPQVQDFLKDTAVKYLSRKLKTEVRLKHLRIDFPNSVELDSFYLADQKGDTLVYSGRLYVGIDMMALFSGDVQISTLELNHFSGYVSRTLPDTTFNFDFILKAFSSGKPKEPDTSKSSTVFDIRDIALSNIHVSYKDAVTGYDVDAYLGRFKTHFDQFNLDSMKFSIDSIILAGINADIVQTAPLIKDTISSPEAPSESNKMPELNLKALALNRIFVHYNNRAAGMSGILNLDKFQLIPNDLDLNKQIIDLKRLELDTTNIVFGLYKGTEPLAKTDTSEITENTTASSSKGWTIKLDQLRLTDNNLKYDDDLKPTAPRGIDYNHLAVTGLNINVDNAYYSTDSSHAMINNISFREKSGFDLQKLTTEATYTSHGAALNKLYLQTPNTVLKKYIAISYDSLSAIGDDPGHLGIQASLADCVINLNDVLYFQPSLDSSASMRKLMHAAIQIKGEVTGKLDSLAIDSLEMRTGSQTHLAVNARLMGLPDMNKAVFDVNLQDLSTGRSDIRNLLPATMIPSSVSIPGRLALRGTYKGSMNTFNSRMFLTSSYGNISINGRVRNLNDSLRAAYQALLRTDRFDLGKFLKNDTLYGKVTLRTEVKGHGITQNSADAELKGYIQQAVLKGYDYHNLTFNGNFQDQKGEINMQSKDPNIRFELTSSADLAGQYPAVKLNLDLDSANLYALHLTTDTLKFRGRIKADFPTADVDHLNGKLWISNLQVVKSKNRLDVDSINLAAVANDTIDSLHLDAPFAKANLFGDYQLSKTGDLIQSLIHHYFGEDSSTRALADSAGKQDIHFDLALIEHPLWQQLLPSLRQFSGAFFTGELASFPQRIQLKGNVPQVVLGDLQIDSMKLNVQSDSSRLNYGLTIEKVNNGSLLVHKTGLYGSASHDNLSVNLNVEDDKGKSKYHLAGLLNVDQEKYRFSFAPDSLLLNYQKWQMPQDNYIVYQPDGIVANNLKLENNGQYLLINSPEKNPDSPLVVNFHDFKLETLTRIASTDTALVSGSLNGTIVGSALLTNPVFTTDLNIDSLAIKDQPVGNIAVQVNNKIANAYAVNVALTGDSNDLKINGTYYTKPQSKFDFDIAIPSLSMASVQAFTFGQINHASGALTGNLRLEGTTDQPHINGRLTFKKAALTVTKINNYLRMPDETIRFDDRGIHFNQFTLIDSLNNKAIVNGSVLTTNYKNYQFALNLTARNFRALNAEKNADEFFYGPLFIDADVRVRGNENLPKVDMAIKLDPKSSFTVELPGSNPQVESSEGIVEFVDAGHMKDTVQLGVAADTISRSALKGIQLSSNIIVDTAAVLNIVIDPTSGDKLSVQGNATLNMTMDPSGKVSLTGRYEISNGIYSMSLKGLIKRQFEITSGSTITWTGDPTSATLDLTAVYNIETSAMELVADQLPSDQTTRNTYKQKLPFEVLLHINGELMKPDISFGLDMPETSRNAFNGTVYTRLQQINTSESEVNKQVLGLLVLGHFIADNPFQSMAGGGGAEQMVRESASKILSQQLNNLAGDLIQGVDINFDLESSQDYSTGQAENQTNLNVGISKSLFNDRTNIYVGSNIQLEGPQQKNQKTSQIAGDVAIEYKLSRDGRYRLRAYRKNKYQGVIEGQYIETGLKFIIVMDYDHFKELFQKAKKEEQEF